MSVTGFTSGAAEVEELQRLVGGLRRRAGYERALRYGLRGCAGALAATLVVAAAHRLLGISLPAALSAALVAFPPSLAAMLAIARWPSQAEAARMADDLLGLEERLGTAVELLGGAGGHGMPLALLQLGDALSAGRDAASRWPGSLGRARRELAALAILGALVLGGLLLLHPSDGLRRSGRAPGAPVPAVAGAGAAPSAALLPASPPTVGQPSPGALPGAAGEQRVGTPPDSSEQRAALDELARALAQMSASHGAAEQLARGNYQGASDELAALGEQVDQLSDAARQRLSQALQATGENSTAADPALSAAEQRAAEALTGSDYQQERQALADLGREVARAGNDQGSRAPAAAQPGAPQPGAAGDGQAGGQSADPANRPGPAGEAGPGGQGEQGAGPATSHAGDPSGQDGDAPATDQPSRLDATGEKVEVPVQLLPGAASTQADAAAEPVGQQEGAAAGIGGQAGQAPGQRPTTAAPEQNDVPGDRRATIRNYFDGDGATGGQP